MVWTKDMSQFLVDSMKSYDAKLKKSSANLPKTKIYAKIAQDIGNLFLVIWLKFPVAYPVHTYYSVFSCSLFRDEIQQGTDKTKNEKKGDTKDIQIVAIIKKKKKKNCYRYFFLLYFSFLPSAADDIVF